jgi:hypothetical protein
MVLSFESLLRRLFRVNAATSENSVEGLGLVVGTVASCNSDFASTCDAVNVTATAYNYAAFTY